MELSSVLLAIGGTVAAVTVLAWLAGRMKVGTVQVHTSAEINASKETVWAVLVDFKQYPNWNPSMIEVHADPQPGNRMDWKSKFNGAVRDLNARIDRVDTARELSWTGPISGLERISFWGHHRMIIDDLGGNRVRLTNTEEFGGLMTIPMRSLIKNDVSKAYEAVNAALKQRAEAIQRGR